MWGCHSLCKKPIKLPINAVATIAWRSLGQRRDGERGGERGDGDGLDVLEPEGLGVGEDEADRGPREGTHGEAEGVRAVERRCRRPGRQAPPPRNLRANLGPVFGGVIAVLCRAKLARSVARVRIDMSLCSSTRNHDEIVNWR